MNNIPTVKTGLIAVSRDCFPRQLSERRRAAIKEAAGDAVGYECPITVENEVDAKKAYDDVIVNGVNALIVYLGNFGPETPETLLADWFDGPVMFIAAAEGDGDLIDGRGDAYCGLLNCSYNLGLRNKRAYIPERPVGTAKQLAKEIGKFIPVARALIGLSKLKIFSFGPRPQDFLACNAPIKPLYDLGVAIEENSELDLLVAMNEHENDERIPALAAEMAEELGNNNPYAGILPRLAQYELTVRDWIRDHLGAYEYAAVAAKCWPAFQTQFKMVPCYVNSRLAASGIPAACETDIYGALSEYIGTAISGKPTTLLDINNTVPEYLYSEDIAGRYDYKIDEMFMGFHCGNTCSACLSDPHLSYQLIMKRQLEPDRPEPDITRGTLNGNIKASPATIYRLQSSGDAKLSAYAAEGEFLDVNCRSFGSIGTVAVPEMGRFYRHVLVEKHYPHHTAVMFDRCAGVFFEVCKYLGVDDISYNRPAGVLYPSENPFSF
ncbi:MAG: fucose isomerase [Clostridia bacterium]|nr:fucose isomerase [Clostridia bacterium]